jgi:hypothetical protein
MLAARVTRCDRDPRRQVSQADGGLGLVLMLPTRAAGAERLDPALRNEGVVVGQVGPGLAVFGGSVWLLSVHM